MTEEDMRQTAARRADAKLGFRAHLIVFVVVNLGLVALNLATSPGYLWFVWPLLGWGIGLVAHGAAVHSAGSNLRQAMIDRELQRLRAASTRE